MKSAIVLSLVNQLLEDTLEDGGHLQENTEIVLTEGGHIHVHLTVSTEGAEETQEIERGSTETGIVSIRRAGEETGIVQDRDRRSIRREDKADQTLQESDF